jgi:predicted sulfurtransferase
MRYIFSIMMISVLAVLVGCQGSAAPKSIEPLAKAESRDGMKTDSIEPHQDDDGAARISLTEAKAAFDDGNVLFIDTRGVDSFKAEHVKGAINIPSGEFETRYTEVPKDKKIIAYCT